MVAKWYEEQREAEANGRIQVKALFATIGELGDLHSDELPNRMSMERKANAWYARRQCNDCDQDLILAGVFEGLDYTIGWCPACSEEYIVMSTQWLE